MLHHAFTKHDFRENQGLAALELGKTINQIIKLCH
jgi:hypothetical protein